MNNHIKGLKGWYVHGTFGTNNYQDCTGILLRWCTRIGTFFTLPSNWCWSSRRINLDTNKLCSLGVMTSVKRSRICSWDQMWDCDSFRFIMFMNEMIVKSDLHLFVKFWICRESYRTFVASIDGSRCWYRNINFLKWKSKPDAFEACRRNGSVFSYSRRLGDLCLSHFWEIREFLRKMHQPALGRQVLVHFSQSASAYAESSKEEYFEKELPHFEVPCRYRIMRRKTLTVKLLWVGHTLVDDIELCKEKHSQWSYRGLDIHWLMTWIA